MLERRAPVQHVGVVQPNAVLQIIYEFYPKGLDDIAGVVMRVGNEDVHRSPGSIL
jgi:hypothetical protein